MSYICLYMNAYVMLSSIMFVRFLFACSYSNFITVCYIVFFYMEHIKNTWINWTTYNSSGQCGGWDIRHPDPRWATMTCGEMFL